MNETVQGLEDSKGMGKSRLLHQVLKIKFKTKRGMPDYNLGFDGRNKNANPGRDCGAAIKNGLASHPLILRDRKLVSP